MAVVQDAFTATKTRTVFVKPPDAVRQFTQVPRALVNFTVNDGTVSAKPVNDQQEIAVNIPLDEKWAYRLVDLEINLIQDVANAWNPRGYLEILNGIRNLQPNMTVRQPVIIDDFVRVPTAVQGWMAVQGEDRSPKYIIQAVQGATTMLPIVMNFRATNQSAPAGAAGVLNVFLSFFEYEIEQAEYFALHAPFLVYQR